MYNKITCLNTAHKHKTVEIVTSCCKFAGVKIGRQKVLMDKKLDLGRYSFFDPALVNIPPSSTDARDNRGNVQEPSALVGKGIVRV